jgi:predicted dehydrogenase
MTTIRVGVVGCGKISGAYFNGAKPFGVLDIVACADLNADVAAACAQQHHIRALSVADLIADPGIDLVLNLTIPKAHAEINLAALHAGKHAYTEKPFAVTPTESKPVLDLAAKKKLRVGSAPDTFLGGGIQTCRKLIDEGAIGTPVAATAFLLCHGHESWHPSPEFYYEKGGGPMLDMGPYYLTALVNLLGPIHRVTGSTRTTFAERTITSQPKAGKKVTVEVPTHYAGVVDFASGAIGTLIMSFDVWGHSLPRIEIYGTEGSLSVPDPNTFKGPVRLRKPGEKDWTEVPLTHSDQVGRGIGIADLASAILKQRPHRANGDLAYHVLEVMTAFEEASRQGRHLTIHSTCARPAPLPVGLQNGEVD